MVTAAATHLSTLKIEKVLKGSEGWGTWQVLMLDWMKTHRVGGFVDHTNPYSQKLVVATAVTTGTGASAVTTSIGILADDVEAWEHIDHQILATMRRLVDENVLKNIQFTESSLEAWDRLKTVYQLEDMVAVGSIRGTFFNLRLAEGESVEEHVCNLDYALILSNSLPKSWDAFRQTLQPDLNGLRVVADRERIARVVRSKVCDRKGHLKADCWTKAKADKKKKAGPAWKANTFLCLPPLPVLIPPQ